MTARAERAFRDVRDFMRRTAVSRPVTEALAHAGAFDRSLRTTTAASPSPPLRRDDRRGRARGRSAHAHDGRRSERRARVQGLLRRRGRACRARGAGPRRHPAHRELLRTAARRPRGHARERPPAHPGRLEGHRRGREGVLADAGDPQRAAHHLPHARRRDGAGRGHGVRVGATEGGQDRVPRVRAGGGGRAATHRRGRGERGGRGGLGPHGCCTGASRGQAARGRARRAFVGRGAGSGPRMLWHASPGSAG